MKVGRPRTICPDEEGVISLGLEMVEWVSINQPLHLSQWYSIEKFITTHLWETLIRKPEFLPYYELALRIIGAQYLDKNSDVREGVSQRWQRVYFKDLRQEEDDTLRFKSQLEIERMKQEILLKSEQGNITSEEVCERLDQMITFFKTNQSSRRIDDKSKRADIKS